MPTEAPAGEYSFDLTRIFLGDLPPVFLLEVAFRTIFIFGYTLLLIRLMGKRDMGQLTPFEFAIIVAIGSAVGDPMFYDDVPLLHTMLVIALVLGLQKMLVYLTERNQTLERIIESHAAPLVDAGAILIDSLHNELLSQEELFESLREQGVRHLGQVANACLEPSGKLSVIRAVDPQPGLSVMPCDCDDPDARVVAGLRACTTCGMVERGNPADRAICPNCECDEWGPAVMVDSEEKS
jgi:uncharacterized membrane protein YcaP (DUF421 family)